MSRQPKSFSLMDLMTTRQSRPGNPVTTNKVGPSKPDDNTLKKLAARHPMRLIQCSSDFRSKRQKNGTKAAAPIRGPKTPEAISTGTEKGSPSFCLKTRSASVAHTSADLAIFATWSIFQAILSKVMANRSSARSSASSFFQLHSLTFRSKICRKGTLCSFFFSSSSASGSSAGFGFGRLLRTIAMAEKWLGMSNWCDVANWYNAAVIAVHDPRETWWWDV